MILIFSSCERDIAYLEPILFNLSYILLEKPNGFPDAIIPLDNPMTREGVKLGKKLFYDPILSGNNTMSCASCHIQSNAFANNLKFNIGIDGTIGNRNAMPLINLAWSKDLNWNGNSSNLESQALEPVVNPIKCIL